MQGNLFRADGYGKGGKLFPVLRIRVPGGILAQEGVFGHGSHRRRIGRNGGFQGILRFRECIIIGSVSI